MLKTGTGEHFSLSLALPPPDWPWPCLRFLAYVDLLGVTYSASTLATGYGAYIAQPLLRKAVEGREDTLTEAEARKILEEALLVLFYRDARSINQVRASS